MDPECSCRVTTAGPGSAQPPSCVVTVVPNWQVLFIGTKMSAFTPLLPSRPRMHMPGDMGWRKSLKPAVCACRVQIVVLGHLSNWPQLKEGLELQVFGFFL